MASGIKIKAKENNGVVEFKALMRHAMETGTRKDSKTGELVPAHYIREVTVEANGKVVMQADWGPAVSKNPFISFKFKGAAKGDTVKLTWLDNLDKTESQEAPIK